MYFFHNLKTMHPFKMMFHGEIHMDYANIPNQFQKILVHVFQEIDLHHFKPSLVFLKSRASIDHIFYMERCIMMMGTC